MADLQTNSAGIKSPHSFCGLNRAKAFLAVNSKLAAAIHSRLTTEAN